MRCGSLIVMSSDRVPNIILLQDEDANTVIAGSYGEVGIVAIPSSSRRLDLNSKKGSVQN
jgi:hypothetical protein